MAKKLTFNEDVMCLTAEYHDDIIACGYEKGFLNLWDLRCESPILNGRFGQANFDDVPSLKFKPGEIHVASGKLIYHLDWRKVEKTSWCNPRYAFNRDDINQISISDNYEILAAGDDDNSVALIDLKKHCLMTHLKKHKNVVYTVQFRPGKSRELITGGFDCILSHWDVFKSRVLCSFDLGELQDLNWSMPKAFNPSYVLCCHFGEWNSRSNKANIVLAGTENGTLHCFHCEKVLMHYNSFRVHDLGITDVKQMTYPYSEAQSGRKNIFCTGSNDGKVKMWDVDHLFSTASTKEPPKALKIIDHSNKINSLSNASTTYLIICDTSSDITMLPMQSL